MLGRIWWRLKEKEDGVVVVEGQRGRKDDEGYDGFGLKGKGTEVMVVEDGRGREKGWWVMETARRGKMIGLLIDLTVT